MKAAFVLSPFEVVVDDVAKPYLGEHEVLVRVEACGICASDIKFYKGLKMYRETPFGRTSPGFTGHEWVGVVADMGPGVTQVRLGDRVIPYIITSCGLCKYCRKERENLCVEKRYIHGGFAEYVKVPEQNLIKVSGNIKIEDACLTEPTACCLHAMEQLNLKGDETVVIIGDGSMGLLNLEIVKKNCSRVVVVGHHEKRLDLANKMGADLVINSLEKDPYEAVTRFTDGYGADVVILAVNNRDSLSDALRLVCKGGHVIVFAGAHPDYETTISSNMLHYNEVTISGSADALKRNYRDALSLIENGTLKPSTIITHTFTLERIHEALESVRKRLTIKAVIKP
ncbi:MAG: alcohol dehydrogenase catalytic domain-containing protein [Thermosphaera sp.]